MIFLIKKYDLGRVLSGKVGMGMYSPETGAFWPFRFTDGPFYLKIGLDIGHIFAKSLTFDQFFH